MTFLTSCATGNYSVVVCPSIVEYTEAFQMRAASEIEMLAEGSAVLVLIQDYSQLRDRVRACK
jgi:hypothetical protein